LVGVEAGREVGGGGRGLVRAGGELLVVRCLVSRKDGVRVRVRGRGRVRVALGWGLTDNGFESCLNGQAYS